MYAARRALTKTSGRRRDNSCCPPAPGCVRFRSRRSMLNPRSGETVIEARTVPVLRSTTYQRLDSCARLLSSTRGLVYFRHGFVTVPQIASCCISFSFALQGVCRQMIQRSSLRSHWSNSSNGFFTSDSLKCSNHQRSTGMCSSMSCFSLFPLPLRLNSRDFDLPGLPDPSEFNLRGPVVGHVVAEKLPVPRRVNRSLCPD